MKETTLGIVLAIIASGAIAQDKKAPDIKLLTPQECAQITKRSDSEYYIKGPVTIGGLTMSDNSIGRDGFSSDGVDAFDFVTRSCFSGKPS